MQLPPITCLARTSTAPGQEPQHLCGHAALRGQRRRRFGHQTGLSALVLVNAHGGNYVLSNIVQEANAKGSRMALFPSAQDWRDARSVAQLESSMHEDMHAGEIETSILLHSHPELVKDGYQGADWVADDRRHLLTQGMSAYTTSGVIGRPSLATADKGKAVLASFVHSFADVLRMLKV